MRTIVDVINLSPSYPLNGDVLKRVWTDKDVSYKHLRVLVTKLLFTFQRIKGPSLIASQDNVFFLATGMIIDCGIRSTRKLFEVVMLCFLKTKQLKTLAKVIN